MTAPFYKFGLFGDEAALIIAFLTGIAFGFFLERAGFGSARKLAAQFYLTDLSVLKVMFTAIITAMTGLYILSRIGFVDLSMVYLVPTFVLPQIAGGLLLGIGFVIGGYCPGTSCVSAATGRIDGIVYVTGMIAGLVAFGEVYPLVQNFVRLTPMGQITLPALFHLSYGLLVFAVVLMALGAFLAAEWAERKFGGRQPDPMGSLLSPLPRLTPVRWLALGLAAAGLGAALAGSPYRGARVAVDTRDLALRAATGDTLAPSRIADWIIQGRNDFTLVDLRSPADFAAYHIPGARSVPLATLAPDFAPRNEKIVLCSADGAQAAQAWFLLQAQGFRSVYLLDGGIAAWRDSVLFPAQSPGQDPASFAKQAAVARFFGGSARIAGAAASAAPAALPKLAPPALPALPANAGAQAPAKKKKEGC